MLIANTTKFVKFCIYGCLLLHNSRIVNLSGVGACCSIGVGCKHLGGLNVRHGVVA